MKEIQLLNRRKEIVGFTMVDDDDFDHLSNWDWILQNGTGKYPSYAIRFEKTGGKNIKVYMHRVILGLPCPGRTPLADHVDGNGLNNRRSNLRVCTSSQNMMNRGRPAHNTSGLKGASWHSQNKNWIARIVVKKKQISLGAFSRKEDAHAAYCAAVKKYHGEFANAGTT